MYACICRLCYSKLWKFDAMSDKTKILLESLTYCSLIPIVEMCKTVKDASAFVYVLAESRMYDTIA